MRACLIVSYAFPPSSSPGALRIDRMIRRLPQHGWLPHIVTVGDAAVVRSATAREASAGVSGTVIRVDDPIAGAARTVGSASSGTSGRKSAVRSLAQALLFPDRTMPWALKLRGVRDQVRALAPEVVLSTSPSLSSHFAARGLARAAGARWVSEFRDPASWLPEQDETGPLRRKALARVERWAVEHADASVTISEAFSEYFRSIYPGADIHTVPNGTDFQVAEIEAGLAARDARLARKAAGEPLVLVHAGALYNGAREPGPLIEAARRAAAAAPRPIRLRFIGPDSHLAATAAASLGASELVESVGAMDHADTVRETEQADVVVALLHRDPVARIGIMSKFFDYAATGNPVLVVGERQAMLSRIVEDEGAGAAFGYDDIDGLAGWIAALAADPGRVRYDAVALSRNWSADRTAEMMAGVLEEVARR